MHRATPNTAKGIHWKYKNTETSRLLIYHDEIRAGEPGTKRTNIEVSGKWMKIFGEDGSSMFLH